MPDDRWSLDFVSDQLACGRRFRILAIFDDCTRECLAAVADTSLSGGRVARELDHLIALRGKPKMIVSDNGTELTSNAILGWSDQTQVGWHYIAPGKPTQNAFVESFNGRLRDEFLNETLFTSLMQARLGAGRLAARLQHGAASFAARLAGASRLCRKLLTTTRPRRCARQWLRALAYCSIVQDGNHQKLDKSRGQRQTTTRPVKKRSDRLPQTAEEPGNSGANCCGRTGSGFVVEDDRYKPVAGRTFARRGYLDKDGF
jgi:hypothetical protein